MQHEVPHKHPNTNTPTRMSHTYIYIYVIDHRENINAFRSQFLYGVLFLQTVK